MWAFKGINILLIVVGLSLNFRIEELWGSKDYNYEVAALDGVDQPTDRQDGKSDLVLPVFLTTFLASTLVNLLGSELTGITLQD